MQICHVSGWEALIGWFIPHDVSNMPHEAWISQSEFTSPWGMAYFPHKLCLCHKLTMGFLWPLSDMYNHFLTLFYTYWQLLTITDTYWHLLTLSDTLLILTDTYRHYWQVLMNNCEYWGKGTKTLTLTLMMVKSQMNKRSRTSSA